MKSIDINCDLGEGMGNEALLMPLISSCNIACGGHAGDDKTMSDAVKLAKKFNVKIGAHPSFPDRENFGRKVLDMTLDQLYDTVYNQVKRLNSILRVNELHLSHVKPHGALYNLAAVNENIANVIVDVVKAIDDRLPLCVPYKSVIATIAQDSNVPIIYEVFIDRKYNEDLTLVSRNYDNALIRDPNEIFQHVYGMITQGKVTAINGVGKVIKAHTFCIHGDGENVVQNLRFLVRKLKEFGIVVL